MPNQMPLGFDIMAGEGEKMDFVKDRLKAAASLDTFFTAKDISNDWLELRGRKEICPRERARLHSNFRERLNKLVERDQAIRKDGVARHRGQLAAGWAWNPGAPDEYLSDY